MSHSQLAARPDYPFLNFALAVAGGYLAFYLASRTSAGHEWLGIVAFIVAVYALRRFSRSLSGFMLHRRMRRANRAIKNVGTAHGSSRWGTQRDAVKAGMHRQGCFAIARLGGKMTYKNGEGAATVFAPPGAGKTASLVIPQYLRKNVDEHGRPISIVGFDFSGEIYSVCAKRLRRLGYNVVLIAPWWEEMSDELGVELEDTGFNPILVLLNAGTRTKDLAWQIATLLRPDDPKSSGSSKFFQGAAREALVFGLLYLASQDEPERLNLVGLRKLLMSSPEQLDLIFAEALLSDKFGGTLQELANKLNGTRTGAPEEWSGTINTATQTVEIFDGFGPLGQSVSATEGVDFASIKSGKPTVVLFVMKPEYAQSHGAWLNLCLAIALEQVGRDRTNKKCLFILDEFASTDLPVPSVLKAIALYRKQGVMAILYLQSVTQLEKIYGRETVREVLGMSELVVGFGVRDLETCKLLSELTGQETAQEISHNVRPDVMGAGAAQDYSSGSTARGKALIRPEQIRELPSSKCIVLYKNCPPFKMDTVLYFKDRTLRKHAEPNPYYRR